MPIELDPQSLKEYADQLVAWVKRNPAFAALAGGGVLVVILFILLVASIFRAEHATQRVSLAQGDPDICKRLQSLEKLGPSMEQQGRGQELQRAAVRAFEELTRSHPSPDDLAVLFSLSQACSGLSSSDFAWLVNTETRLKRGVWPDYPPGPPHAPRIRSGVVAALKKQPRLDIALPADDTIRSAWLMVAADEAEPPAALVAQFVREKDPPMAVLAVYQKLAAERPTSPLVAKLYERLGLLSRPIYVLDTSPVPIPASLPALDGSTLAPKIERGPENTLPFLGVLAGEDCAIAASPAVYPLIWVRPCRGLVPRRLPEGELLLLGIEVKLDGVASHHWLPLLIDEGGLVLLGENLRRRVADPLIAAFVRAAPRFGVGVKGVAPYLAELTTVEPSTPSQVLSFSANADKGHPELVAFSGGVAVQLDKKDCSKVERGRCDALRGGEPRNRCDVGAPTCALLPGGHKVRWTRTHVVQPEPCLEEYGEDTHCRKTELFGLFVDLKATRGSQYVPAAHVTLLEQRP